MSEDIATYLQSRGVAQVKRASAFEVNLPCLFCNEPDGKRGRLYINTDPNAEIPGLFYCHLCGAKGSLVSIKKFFGDVSESDEKEDDGFIRRALLEASADFYHEALTENEKVWSWLKNKRGLTIETVRKFRLGYANGGLYHYLKEREFKTSDILATGLVRDHNGIKDLFDQHLTIPYQVAGNVMMIRGRDLRAGAERKYVTPSGQKARLYNSDAVWTADQVVACEGEFDCIVLSQLGYAAVAVPGANSWQPTWNDYFSDTRRLYVVFDGDDAGRKGADKVQEILGIKARRVEMPPGTDISDWIVTEGHTKEDFDKLLKGSAGGLLVTVDEAYEEYCKVQGQTGLKFGYSELDFHLEPGLLPGQILISLARTGVGKGHVLDTEVPTPSGIRRWGDLQVGDEVFGSDGRTTRVIGVYDRGILPTYRVTFSDRTSVVTDAEHLWTVHYRHGKRRTFLGEKTLSTQELAAGSLSRPHNDRTEYLYRVPMTEPVQYPERDLPIEPYTLGALIANGGLTQSSAMLTTPDYEVIERIRLSHQATEHCRPDEACPRFCLNGLISEIRSLGLDVKSGKKFIPAPYLTASVDQRVALLQGLMDGDGSSRKRDSRSSVMYFTSSPQLADDIVQLVSSLGGTAMVRWYEREDEAPEGHVNIMLPEAIEPFGTRRKEQGVNDGRRRVPYRAIVGVELTGKAEVRCIAVNAPDSLYLVGREHVVTHNTISLLNLLEGIARAQPDANMLFISLEQTRGDWFERARRIRRFHNLGTSDQDALDFWRQRLMLVDKNRVSIDQIYQVVDDYIYEMGSKPDVVALDYLGYFARSFKGEAYQRTTDAVMTLKEFAKESRISVVVPHQMNRSVMRGATPSLEAARDSGAVEETADIVLGLSSPDNSDGRKWEERTGELDMVISKSRHGSQNKSLRNIFAPLSLAIVPENEHPLAEWARNEIYYQVQYREDWEMAQARHEAGTRKDEPDYRKVERLLWQKRQGKLNED